MGPTRENGNDTKTNKEYKGGHGHIDGFYLKGDPTRARAPITVPYDPEHHNIISWGYWSKGWTEKTGNTNGCGGGDPDPPLPPPPLPPPPLPPPPLPPTPLPPPPLPPTPPPPPPPPTPPIEDNNGGNPGPNLPPAVATKLVKISGDDQEGLINTELANPFIVEVHDQNNAAFDGATVTFDITAGGGSLSTTIITTDANGRAESTLTLGPNLGTNTVSVSAAGVQGTETFNAEAVETLTPPTDGNNNSNGNNGGGNNGGNNGGGNNQEPDIPQRNEPESDEDNRFMFQLDLYAGWNFIHIPLEVTQVNGESMSIETLGNLFQVLMPAHMYVHDGSCWIEVFGDSEQALGTNQGVVVYMDAPLTVNLVGSPLPGTFSIERGLTFVGLPRQSTGLQKVSDFLTFYPEVCVVLVTVEGELYLVGRAGDSGNVEITGGQAFGIVAVEQYMTNFNGAAWGKVYAE